MKVLFAVSNENISESIIKKYQKNFKEIISTKNVYYFNAIQKELQKDNTYDRIVISEDLEPFANNNYDAIDKFIFDKLDVISDEATNSKRGDTPIILICSDRRNKSEDFLVKIFSIGVYDAVLGDDRSIDQICNLIKKPRTKKEAKVYYKIDTDDVKYSPESEDEVSEVEIQNILNHYKKISKNEERFAESFESIASQYNQEQLKLIANVLPLNVKAVLETSSPSYQRIMTSSVRNYVDQQKKEKNGISVNFINDNNLPTGDNIIIPQTISKANAKRVTRTKTEPQIQQKEEPKFEMLDEDEDDEKSTFINDYNNTNTKKNLVFNYETNTYEEIEEKPKRGRGRPKKTTIVEKTIEEKQKKGRGRPRKVENYDEINEGQINNKGYEDVNLFDLSSNNNEDAGFLPGFESNTYNNITNKNENSINNINNYSNNSFNQTNNNNSFNQINNNYNEENDMNNNYENSYSKGLINTNEFSASADIRGLLTYNKKLVAFVGTSKNGTSFIVNNTAEVLSQSGINTAILDTTRNKNSFYIYTQNEEQLRKVAAGSIRNLQTGIAQGIVVNKNLTVYTGVPDEEIGINNYNAILHTILKNHDLVLVDADFYTPEGYFAEAQEIYLVQSLDVLTIQPLTSFLRDLKAKNILSQEKIRIIINKNMKVRGLTEKAIIGGMSYYNEPSMSFMTELFNRDTVRYCTMPFEPQTYSKYLEGLVNCKITLNGYSKIFMQSLNYLSNMIYPLLGSKSQRNSNLQQQAIQNQSYNQTRFSQGMNDTLNQMKRNF